MKITGNCYNPIEKCEFNLMGNYYPSIEDVVSTFIVCDKVEALRIRVRCFNFMVKYFGIVSLLEDFSSLPSSIQATLKDMALRRSAEELAEEKKLVQRLRSTLLKTNK